DPLAQSAEQFLVEERRCTAAQPIVNDEAHRIRSDIHDGHRLGARRADFQYLIDAHFLIPALFSSLAAKAGGRLSFGELPRPESEGLFMKYSWALKGSS